MRRLVLAIDSGGSKCDALLATASGLVLGWGRCDFSDPASGRGRGGSGRTHDTVEAATARALPDGLTCDELHIVGRRSLPAEAAPEGFIGRVVPHWVREHDVALALAGAEAGVVALAGTGAFVFGRTRTGEELLLDALGPLLGDYGGGYRIGHAAIRAAACSRWHARRATALTDPVLAACRALAGGGERFSLVEYMLGNPDRAEIASLARLVDEAARAGDAIACEILREEAGLLAETVHDVVDRLGLAGEDLPLIAHGSVARCSGIYWAHVCECVRQFAPRLRPVVPELPAVAGVALPVLEELGEAPDEVLRTNLAAGLGGAPHAEEGG